MGLIGGPPVALMDVANCESFVQRTIDKSCIRYTPSEREDLLAEGLTILFELAGKYNPGVGGRDATNSRFSGYAAMFLPRRLGDAWHKMHPEHRYITHPETGKRGWYYGDAAISLNAITDERDGDDGSADRQLLHARTITNFTHTATLALLSRVTPQPVA